MADDIDDLLNEVENSYISSKPGAQAKAPPRKPPAKPKGWVFFRGGSCSG